MIYGIGIDFLEINRIRKSIFRLGDRLANRVLSYSEWKIYKNSNCPVNFLAKRFAAKEAASKAFGIGICNGLSFKNFEVCNDVLGKPTLRIFGYAEVLFNKLSLSTVHITLSDDGHYVIAVVIFER